MKKIILLLIIVYGAIYRFYNLNWDEGHWFHPDERNIAMAVSKLSFFDQLNPQFFAYNGLWIYLTRGVAEGVKILTDNESWLSGWGEINLIIRSMSAVFSVLSLLLVFKVARKLLGTKAALLATALSAYTVGYLQYAHYGVTESLLVFWVLLIIDLTLNKRWLLVSLAGGLAVATKTAALSFLLIPFLAGLGEMLNRERRWDFFRRTPLMLIIFAISCFVFTPYSFLSWSKFRESMAYEGGVVSGQLQVPYNLQFAQTQPYLFPLTNLLWHLGPLVMGFGVVGVLGWLVHQALSRKASPFLPALIFAVAYFGYVGQWYAKFMRYLLPIYPVLIIAAAWLLFGISRRYKNLGLVLIALTLTSTLLWSAAYMTVFQRPSTRITASKWIFEAIPADSRLLTEHWDDRLPTGLSGFSVNYEFTEMTNYEPDNQVKLDQLSKNLADGDYIILSSRRLYGSIGQNPDRYPLTSYYYQQLFAEKLGYTLVARFDSYPQLGPLVINDDGAEETFQIYDHPTIFIFQNTGRYSAEQLKNLLQYGLMYNDQTNVE